MNKTAIFITFACLAALGIGGTLIIRLHKPEATATFTAFVFQILGRVSVAAATLCGFGKQGEKIDRVVKQTNGNLHRVQSENERLTNILIERGINPDEPKHAA